MRALLRRSGSVQGPVPVPGLAVATEEPPFPGWPLPQLVSLFLPEFPVRPSARQQQLKVPSGDRCSAPGNPSASPGSPRVPCASRRVPSRPVPALSISRRDLRAPCPGPRAVGAFQRGLRAPYGVPVHPYRSPPPSHRVPFPSRSGPLRAFPLRPVCPTLRCPHPLCPPVCPTAYLQDLISPPACPVPLTHAGPHTPAGCTPHHSIGCSAPVSPPLPPPSDPGLGGQRLLRYHPKSVGLREREGLRREGECCPTAWGFRAAAERPPS